MAFVEVGDKIRDARMRIGLTQEELAELARLNRVTVAKYESGKVEPGAQALSRIADALDVTVDELLGRNAADDNNRSNDIKPRTVEARIVSFGMDQLPQEDREKLLAVVRAMYSNKPDLFTNRKDDDHVS